jgi:hypothetical protein
MIGRFAELWGKFAALPESWNDWHMHPGFLALVSGGLLYIASAAVSSMQAFGEAKVLAWLGVGAVVLCHAALGFLVIGDQGAVSRSARMLLLRAAASGLMTALVLAAAVLVVSLFPLPLAPDMALILMVLSVLASIMVLTVTAGRTWRGPNR